MGQDRIERRGGSYQLTWSKTDKHTCAYVGSLDRPAADPLTGVAVIDVTDPTKPETITVLRDPGAFLIIETLQAKNDVLVAKGNDSSEPIPFGFADQLAIYDISKDCRRPKLKLTFRLPSPTHGGGLSPDGKTMYAIADLGEETYVVDLSNLAKPRLLLTAPVAAHDLGFNLDGMRVYFACGQIFDTSSIEKRAPKPQLRLIGKLRDAGGMRATYGDARTPLELEGKVPDSRQKSAKICENPGGFALLLKKGS